MHSRFLAFGLGCLALFTLAVASAGSEELRDGAGQNPTGPRFQLLSEYGNDAVFDAVTGLTWERSPSPTGKAWSSAMAHCGLKSVGGKRGWRLPSFFELMTLVDPSVHGAPGIPTLPPKHLFNQVQAAAYWSQNSLTRDSTSAYAVDFLAGDLTALSKSTVTGFWCVHGNMATSFTPSPSVRLIRLELFR
jgi:hypothetical protein